MTAPTAGRPEATSLLARAQLTELLEELVQRATEVMDTQDRLRGLLDAVVGLAADLSLDSVLQRIITIACDLADARYGALGVLGSGADRRLREFVTYGFTAEQRSAIGDLPRGHGILGVIIDDPTPLRLDVLGDHPVSYGFPAHHPPMGTFLGVPIRSRGSVFGNLYLTEKRNTRGFTKEDEQIVVALAAAAGVVIENARLYERVGLQKQWLQAAADVTAALMGGTIRTEALAQIAGSSREICAADGAALLLPDAAGWVVVALSGWPSGPELGAWVPGGDPMIDAVLRTGLVVDSRPFLHDPRQDAAATPARWLPDGIVALLPLRTAGETAGLLALGWSAGHDDAFHDADMTLAAAFADQVALALQLGQAREDQARLAVLEDRDRIGRDLHDLVIQRLFAIGLILERSGRQITSPDIAARVARAVDDLDATITDIRQTIFQLSGSSATRDIRAKLAAEIAVLVPALGFQPHLTTEGAVDALVSDAVGPHLLAVLREALSNVARHAAASTADVRLVAGEQIVLIVRDDGIGIAAGSRKSGLSNMLERAESLGGTCTVGPRAGGGTELTWQVPAH